MHAYERVVSVIAGEIEAGDRLAGDMLPTMRELCERFDVSQVTIRTALEQLAQLGLVYSGYSSGQGRRGYIVRSTGRQCVPVTADWKTRRADRDGFAHFAEGLGKEPGSTFEMRFALPPEDVATRLGLGPEEITVVRMSKQTLDGEPWSLEVTWFPRELAAECEVDVPYDVKEGTIRRIAEHGYEEDAWVDEVTDGRADAETAQYLSVEVGTRLLIHTRVAAAGSTVIRVSRYFRLSERSKLLWYIGSEEGLSAIGKD